MTGFPDKTALLERVRPHREKWARIPRPSKIDPVPDGGESVWDFPRPPRVEEVSSRIRVVFAGLTIADTTRGLRICETASAPCYFIPPEDVETGLLVATRHRTVCEWKGACEYHDVLLANIRSPRAAFVYPDPLDDLGRGYSRVAGYFSFYANRVEAWLDDEKVSAQSGGFYAGWVTRDLAGPIKGGPGSTGW